MLVRYIGPFDVVEIEAADKAWVEVAHGATVDLPDDLAASLLEQTETWEAAAGGARKAKASESPTPDADEAPNTPTPEEG